MNKKNLVALITASSILAGCGSMGPVRPGYGSVDKYLEGNPEATQEDYINYVTSRLTDLDAAETEREHRCLKELDGTFAYESKNDAFLALEECTLGKRTKDMYAWGFASILIDGVKVYGLINGLSGGKYNLRDSNPPYNSEGSVFGIGNQSGSTGTAIGSGFKPGQ